MSPWTRAIHQTMLPYDCQPPSPPLEREGAIYTRRWVVELILDLAGYRTDTNLVDALAIEPAAGEGAFLVPMACRLVAYCQRQGRPLLDCAASLIAYEIDESSAEKARAAVISALEAWSVEKTTAEILAAGWLRVADYLFDADRLPAADFVIGNPPYIRLEEIPEETVQLYRGAYPTMRGRADLYVAFYEAALRQLKDCGVCAFICADRWMRNQYGAGLRRLVTDRFSVEAVVEMHETNAFVSDVSAYPAITVIRRAKQGRAIVARVQNDSEEADPGKLFAALHSPSDDGGGVTKSVVESWCQGTDPWPCTSPRQLAILRRLEERFEPLESRGTKVGIGIATGNDSLFITKDKALVEESRLLPLAMAWDTASGRLEWSGHYLIDPWDEDGLVDLGAYPLLRRHFDRHQDALRKRHTARKNPHGWYRTIDRVHHRLTARHKLYIPDIKDRLNPVLDTGQTYPHHNLYFIQSESWDLEVLGGILLSTASQLFVEAYGVRMRGGYLRFQAQYLRRIRVPDPSAIGRTEADQLIEAFRHRDRDLATRVALRLYQIDTLEMDDAARD